MMNIEEAEKQLKELKVKLDTIYELIAPYGDSYSEAITVVLDAYYEELNKNKNEYCKGFKNGWESGLEKKKSLFMNITEAKAVLTELKYSLKGYYTTVIPNNNPYGDALETLLSAYQDERYKIEKIKWIIDNDDTNNFEQIKTILDS